MKLLRDFKSSLSQTSTKRMILSIFLLAFALASLPLLLTAIKYRRLVKMKAAAHTDTAILSLTASTSQIAVGGTVNVEVRLNTGGAGVYGTDVLIKFNKGVLRLTGITENKTTNFKTFVPWVSNTENFDKTKIIADANNNALIEFGAVAFNPATPDADPINSPVVTDSNSNVLVATLAFQGLADGVSTVNFSFDPTSPASKEITTDTNAVGVNRDQGWVEDLLNSFTGASITVGTPPACLWKVCGDANCKEGVNIIDASLFVDEFNGDHIEGIDADFNSSGSVDIVDASLFVDGFNNLGDTCANTPHK